MGRANTALAQRRDRASDVIAVASKHLNTMGVSVEWFAAIAGELGVSRPALYNHVVDRDDLQFRCYLNTCDLLDEATSAAAEKGLTGQAAISRFFDEMTREDRPEFAVMREQGALPEAKRLEIQARQRIVAGALSDLIARAIASGEFRAVDTGVGADTLIGMAGYSAIYRRWMVDDLSDPAAVMKQMFFVGLAADRHTSLTLPGRLLSAPPRKIDPFDRRSLDEARRDRILIAGSTLFNQRGIGATRMEDVAEAVGLSKRALFHHVPSKGALVEACLGRTTSFCWDLLTMAQASSGSRIEALSAAIRDYVDTICDPEQVVLVPDVGAGQVSADGWSEMETFHRRLRDGYMEMLARGQAEGSVRRLPLDQAVACLPSLFTWVSAATIPARRERARVANEVANLVAVGVLA